MHIFLWKHYGGLGNRLLTFSNLLALAHNHGWVVHHLSLGLCQRYFLHFENRAWATWPPINGSSLNNRIADSRASYRLACRILKSRRALSALRRLGRIYERDDSDEVTLESFYSEPFPWNGSWVVWTAWNLHFSSLRDQHRDHVREALRPVESIVSWVDHMVQRARADEIRVGIHVRRGDYAQWLGGRYYYDHGRYRRLMETIETALRPRPVHFFVASNEALPSNLTHGLRASVLGGSEAEDLYALAACDLIAGPPSTYTEWAAFYSGTGRIVVDDPSDEGISRSVLGITSQAQHRPGS
jgi:hypothetical protein